jgi:NDP-sugar pyrophosphorylase family protein
MLLAAGSGTRLRPITDRMPKCMVQILGKPVLEHTIRHLCSFGVVDIMVNLSYRPEVVTDYFGDGSRFGVKMRYSFEQEALGTAGGVRNVASFFDGPFFVWYGDNLSNCDLRRLYMFHCQKSSVATIVLHHRDDPTASGIVGLDGDNRIERFLEKPRPDQVFSHWVNAGIFVIEPEALAAIAMNGQPDFGRDVFPALLGKGYSLYGYRMTSPEGLWWIDMLEDLSRVQQSNGVLGGLL